MKRILLKFMLVFAFIGAILISSCETYIEPPIPNCEKYQTGDIKVVNKLGFSTRFDIYDDGNGVYISNGGSHAWNDIDAGYYTMWIQLDGDWYFWKQDQRLAACETLTFTWNSTKKSTHGIYLEVSKDGEIIETIMEFELDVNRL